MAGFQYQYQAPLGALGGGSLFNNPRLASFGVSAAEMQAHQEEEFRSIGSLRLTDEVASGIKQLYTVLDSDKSGTLSMDDMRVIPDYIQGGDVNRIAAYQAVLGELLGIMEQHKRGMNNHFDLIEFSFCFKQMALSTPLPGGALYGATLQDFGNSLNDALNQRIGELVMRLLNTLKGIC